jgi:heme/copper-type cytochrome/quinol oxidase subunit 2
VTSSVARKENRDKPTSSVATAQRTPQASTHMRQQNRILLMILSGVAAVIFILVLILIIGFHYAEAHHLLPPL